MDAHLISRRDCLNPACRFPRLHKALRNLCFSHTEVDSALSGWIFQKTEYGSEAQNHYGGFTEMVRMARRSHSFRVRIGIL